MFQVSNVYGTVGGKAEVCAEHAAGWWIKVASYGKAGRNKVLCAERANTHMVYVTGQRWATMGAESNREGGVLC